MNSNFYNNEVLIGWRESLGLTQEELANELNVTRQTISRVENGQSASLKLLYALADFYRKPITELLKKNKFAATG